MDQTTLRQALVALGFAGGLTLSVCPSLSSSALNDDDDDERAAKDRASGKDKGDGDEAQSAKPRGGGS